MKIASILATLDPAKRPDLSDLKPIDAEQYRLLGDIPEELLPLSAYIGQLRKELMKKVESAMATEKPLEKIDELRQINAELQEEKELYSLLHSVFWFELKSHFGVLEEQDVAIGPDGKAYIRKQCNCRGCQLKRRLIGNSAHVSGIDVIVLEM